MATDGNNKRRGSMREQYPMLSALGGGKVRFLTHEEAIVATREERIASVWPFLVRTVLEFAETLNARSRANYDPEDVISELYLTLAEKDEKWIPERGKYISFAGRLIANELHAIRERSTTVHSPRNSASRLKGYEADGDLSDRKQKTYVDICRVLGEHEPLDPTEPMDDDEPGISEVAENREGFGRHRATVRKGVVALDPEEADTIGRAFGLFGKRQQDIPAIAESTGKGAEHVRKVLARAQRKFKKRLEEIAAA